MNEMPKDWWPDMLIIRGQVDKGEQRLALSVAMTAEDAAIAPLFYENLKNLRFALWQELQK